MVKWQNILKKNIISFLWHKGLIINFLGIITVFQKYINVKWNVNFLWKVPETFLLFTIFYLNVLFFKLKIPLCFLDKKNLTEVEKRGPAGKSTNEQGKKKTWVFVHAVLMAWHPIIKHFSWQATLEPAPQFKKITNTRNQTEEEEQRRFPRPEQMNESHAQNNP